MVFCGGDIKMKEQKKIELAICSIGFIIYNVCLGFADLYFAIGIEMLTLLTFIGIIFFAIWTIKRNYFKKPMNI